MQRPLVVLKTSAYIVTLLDCLQAIKLLRSWVIAVRS